MDKEVKEEIFYINYEVFKGEGSDFQPTDLDPFILTMRYLKIDQNLGFAYIVPSFILTMRYLKKKNGKFGVKTISTFILTMRYLKGINTGIIAPGFPLLY